MSWALFCQIEVILLTLGLVISFIITARQHAKDDSFFKRIGAIGKSLESCGTRWLRSEIAEKLSKKEEKA